MTVVPPFEDLSRLARRRELLLGAAVTASVAAAVLALGPAPGDAPAHLYRTLLVQHGALVWDNLWYAGNFPLASYSLLYYLPAALVGNVPLVLAAAISSTLLFASITVRQWGAAARWPSRVFGVLAAAPMFTGLYSYELGFATMLAAIRALQSQRTRLAILLAALTVGFSPLAFAFLCLLLAAVGSRAAGASRGARSHSASHSLRLRPSRGRRLLLFSSGGTGVYPFHLIDFVSVIGVSTVGLLLARRARGGTPAGRVLRPVGRRQRRRLLCPVAARGQLDTAVRVRLSADAADRRPRRLSAAVARRPRPRSRVRLQP